MVNTYTNVFTGNPIQVSPTNYRAFSFGSNTTLSWPVVNEDNANVTADIMDVTATTTSLNLIMPPANQVGNGKSCIIRNLGVNTFTVTDNSGNTIISIAAGVVYWVFVTDNSTVNGVWSVFQYGATASSANAAALAGLGLVAITTTLNVRNTPTIRSTDYTALTSDRASTIIWTGGAGIISFTAAATLTSGWFIWIKNFGSGVLTLDPSGAETIDGVTSLGLSPNESCMVVCNGTGFYTLSRSSTGAGSLNAYIATNGAAPSSLPSVAALATSSMAIGSGAIVGGTGPNTLSIGNSYATGNGALSIAINNNNNIYGAQATYSVAIGLQNTVPSTNIQGASIGGDSNSAGGTGGSTILAGTTNVISGGTYNNIVGAITSRITAGSKGCIIGSDTCTISGGASDVIVGGVTSAITASGAANAIIAGDSNEINDTVLGSVIIGGEVNVIEGTTSDGVIIVGVSNLISSSSDCVIAGSTSSTIEGGGTSDAIIGGLQNHINAIGGYNAVVGGQGANITSTGGYCASIGGLNNQITGASAYAVVSGRQSKADIIGKVAHATGVFAATGDAQTSHNVLRASTVGAVTSELLIDGTSRLVIPNDSTWLAWVHIVARRTDTDNFSGAFTRYVAIDRNANAASTALVAAVQTIGTDFNDSTYAITISADTVNGALKIEATGVAAHTVRFVAYVRLVEVTG